jgi:catechol 2,3-dioxygenase-like lactoylglutathione lyase family enzyme
MKILRVHHVKVPVTDLAYSTRWYAALLGLQLNREFVESGTVRGVALRHPSGSFVIALRQRDACASRPVLQGFDPFALLVESRVDMDALVGRCDELRVEHGEIQERGSDEAAVDVIDPDGTVIRFLWRSRAHEDEFVGIHFDEAGTPTFYRSPRSDLD